MLASASTCYADGSAKKPISRVLPVMACLWGRWRYDETDGISQYLHEKEYQTAKEKQDKSAVLYKAGK